MEASRFDRLTRLLATSASRRRTLHGLTGGMLIGLVSLAGSEDAAAACVRPGRKGCDGPRNKRRCKGARCQGGNRNKPGRCTCRGKLKACGRDCVNLKKDNKHCGRCNNRCQGGSKCKNGACTGRLGCTAAKHFCTAGDLASACSDNPSCNCIVDVHGVPHCGNIGIGACSTCTKNADCDPGQVCINARGSHCQCPGGAGDEGTGNACIAARCDAVG